MPRYFIHLAYNGSAYHGWQTQPNAKSVQASLEKALSILMAQKINLIGAGRTDTGVHASSFYAHFDIARSFTAPDLQQWVYRLNAILDKDICVYSIFEVAADLHARFSALSRTYTYRIHTYKNPFENDFSHFVPFSLDVEAMNRACAILMEYADFTCFSKSHTQTKTNFCKIMHASWSQNNTHLLFTIQADRFLRNMVRAIVGTLLEIGMHKIEVEAMRTIIGS
ncbi:MAG: tRNA pseudouridine(38-40) synthase TruA, partial [Bacteroidales bacterium]